MTKVSKVMTKKVPHVDDSDTVLHACQVMVDNDSTGVAVFRGERAVGMMTERSLLRDFVSLDSRPSQVKVSQVMTPIVRIDKDATTTHAAKKMVETAHTRLGVFDGDKFLGWVTLTDVARDASRKHLLDIMLRRDRPETSEVYCPKCKIGVMRAKTDADGRVIRWECDNCSHYE